MSAVEDLLRRAAADLHAAGARYCLIGGMAVSVRTSLVESRGFARGRNLVQDFERVRTL